jgi:hypothetical protein
MQFVKNFYKLHKQEMRFGLDVSWCYFSAARRRYFFEVVLTHQRFAGLLLNILTSLPATARIVLDQ